MSRIGVCVEYLSFFIPYVGPDLESPLDLTLERDSTDKSSSDVKLPRFCAWKFWQNFDTNCLKPNSRLQVALKQSRVKHSVFLFLII